MKKIVYVDMDNVLVDFPSAFPHVPDATLAKYDNDRDNIPGIFALMEPMPGAIEAFHELADLFDVYVLSTSPWNNPSAWRDKLEWIQLHLGHVAYKRLILSHHKNLNVGDYLIDDRTKNGADWFAGEHIHFGQTPFEDWPAIMTYLRARASSGPSDARAPTRPGC